MSRSTAALPAGCIHYRSLGVAAIAIAGLPTAWNIVARNEYHRHTIEKLVRDKRRGAYLLAVAIFLGSSLRDWAFHTAMTNTPSSVLPLLSAEVFGAENAVAVRKAMRCVGGAMMAAGVTLVVSSFARLGVTGTYLGDYFGMLMTERVTAFPFSHFENPMYLGATLNFLAAAIAENNAVGALLTGWVALVYHVSTTYFENPFTSMIYSKRAAEQEAAKAAATRA
ncbi:Phosphatidylethanolaminen-methyltransferase-lik e protein [Leptomonas pyrrhocoris]|uniref:Phosphatidylethanolamine N-methyltransferase n=1 Tax=Leptomonas pyrrhocoris TaxID=157538 RepID=A0A0N0VD12_LEPPY|nr:Phosphatidylethanolaminen-methyltransferase-lik e protein [Leptomonas pyrrhocoris]XP_015652818.1 Phosphatidylethanolaminen-methyltransferase-lik e protein [Leptomonas pyrrhocoris]KPA74378.1 Phosphatidylethanolaminen-methyltransferase-lik e protein [Leptomonas pyrrhocoris]KPA74379.1 Phosphatidylethanolaminen-methyltransferase-lik e protein [Leptomonas pyrrhocoris]|eukprot:XP_015652817.1 Phosphatidylethanolaminen-methyltransferase-lik e protein [Leptomonas pyrrhocoris]